MNEWCIEDNGFNKEHIELNGSRYLIGNGYMGYRGTLEEYSAEQLVALNMAGLFDRNGDLWRESVNAPNPFYTVCFINGTQLDPVTCEVVSHNQALDISKGLHSRKTVFCVDGNAVTVSAERFLSMKNENLAVLKYTVSAEADTEITVKTLVDTNVWNINGQHFAVESTKKNKI